MTHEDLRKRAIQWLTNTKRCGVVLSEMVGGCSEIPDAIGWKGHFSYLVECKASRSDFRANGDKIHVRAQRGVGRLRYFLVPEGLVQPEEVDDGYGLLWCGPHSVRVKKEAAVRDACYDDEIGMLVSALRRVRVREFLILCPEGGPEVCP
jgi:hypothetical protein